MENKKNFWERGWVRLLLLSLFIVAANFIGLIFFDFGGSFTAFFLSGLSFVFMLNDGWEKKPTLGIFGFLIGCLALLAALIIKYYWPYFKDFSQFWHNRQALLTFVIIYSANCLFFWIGWYLAYSLKVHKRALVMEES
jgi:hypothetical protein